MIQYVYLNAKKDIDIEKSKMMDLNSRTKLCCIQLKYCVSRQTVLSLYQKMNQEQVYAFGKKHSSKAEKQVTIKSEV